LRNQRKNRKKRDFLTIIRSQNRQNPVKQPSMCVRSCPLAKSLQNDKNFDLGGSMFYTLVGQTGILDVPAVLGSLYSGVTVLLAWLIGREKFQEGSAWG
jgi:hypothetical protein